MDYSVDFRLVRLFKALGEKDRDYKTIEEYGKDILGSKDFRKIVGQKHHIFSTVGYHSVHVAQIMLLMSRFFDMDEKDIVRGSLWHDVGIYDRDSFVDSMDTAIEHPKRSLEAAFETGTLDDTQSDMIEHHMWPVTHERPVTKEGFFITIADKVAAVTEFLKFHDDRIDAVLDSGAGEENALD
ncbi:MAG: HD domain-containing protein [Lachnospiraceae bacterium]|uniref:HD domain-containing protein n=1 Tax=Candidatus Weimeria bifida TaxID=2599074 RepID=A0A6N7IZ47_9FIRM|nr:HD domain-containing protein [Candidatus Weimeria bifida]RRF97034.1 MAG: HD domain-containing protein [Lachnospiraceae bacterium]